MLDKKNIIKIYGPKKVNGVKAWKGYKNYSGLIPFDGKKIIDEISKCGIALVFSSEEHCQSSLMSNRLFESLAAGAVIIANENPFIRKYFDNTILYVNTHKHPLGIVDDILKHYFWIKNNPKKALLLAKKAQLIFLEKFNLSNQLKYLIDNHHERKEKLESLYLAKNQQIRMHILHIFHMPNINSIETFIKSLCQQSYKNFQTTIYINHGHNLNLENIFKFIKNLNIDCDLVEKNITLPYKSNISIGKLVREFSTKIPENELLHISCGEVEFFSHHISTIIRQVKNHSNKKVFFSDIAIRHIDPHTKEERCDLFKISVKNILNYSERFFIPFSFNINLINQNESFFIDYFDNLLPSYILETAKSEFITTNRVTVMQNLTYHLQQLLFSEQIEIFKENYENSTLLFHLNKFDLLQKIKELPPNIKSKLIEELMKHIPLGKSLRKFLIKIYKLLRIT